MATGHILPGFGQPVTNLKRAKTAYPMDKTKLREYAVLNVPKPDASELGYIRENARQVWSAKPTHATSYNCHYEGRRLDEQTKSRPTSPTRKNKPHPPLVFLTNRLHYIDGMQNPDATLGKGVYRVDGVVPDNEYVRRKLIREKYIPRPHTAAINQYANDGMKDIFPATEAQAASAWLKIADDKDKFQLMNMMQDERTKAFREQNRKLQPPAPVLERSRTDMPSLHRWMKMAGVEESTDLNRVLQSIRTNPDHQLSSRVGSAAGSMKQRRNIDIDAMARIRFVPKASRGEFLMHPDWPPNIPHHHVP
ncbi:uncharacterized protein LOC110459273 [Mizuhopecten yessoensis]|uniref:Uncharacterized protein n=1 Tax=Mizuhopecten yessoensis TaxID=6573 RepID=A0A210Q4X2_MIZYE|nr:uncharacterized protein LOC110459273 [Mizuhopecten yessoensis]OWF43793.1 hypothetical protein KP79_PYT12616 [Mizuhopecten yessoensis]